MNQRYAAIQVSLLENNWSFGAVIIFPHIGLVPVLPSSGSSNLQVTSLLTILAAVHLVTVVGLDVVKLGDVDGVDPGEAARQLRHRLAAELGDVLGAGVHLDDPLGHLLQGQRLAGLGAVPQHLATAAVLEELQTVPGILLFNNTLIKD